MRARGLYQFLRSPTTLGAAIRLARPRPSSSSPPTPARLLASRRDLDGLALHADAFRLPVHLFGLFYGDGGAKIDLPVLAVVVSRSSAKPNLRDLPVLAGVVSRSSAKTNLRKRGLALHFDSIPLPSFLGSAKKMIATMSSMSLKTKELFQGLSPADKIVGEATSDNLDGPDWSANLQICGLLDTEKVTSVDLIRGIKKRIMPKEAKVRYLSLLLLQTILKNCEKPFSEVAAEKVLHEMDKLIDDLQTVVNSRNKALTLIEA